MSSRWDPFWVDSSVMLPPRSLYQADKAGIGDRLRTAAFAEMQAAAAFAWAAERFTQAPEGLREGWRKLAIEERKHMNWLMSRMQELDLAVKERPVTDSLWHSLTICPTARDFALYMADAEERGRRAGERFHEALLTIDPIAAKIFGQIALEERAHIALAREYFA